MEILKTEQKYEIQILKDKDAPNLAIDYLDGGLIILKLNGLKLLNTLSIGQEIGQILGEKIPELIKEHLKKGAKAEKSLYYGEAGR